MGRCGSKPLTLKEIENAKVLFASGKSFNAIGKALCRDRKTIKSYLTEPQATKEIEEMKEELADMFEGLAKRMLTSITQEDIERINSYQRTLSAAVATDKMRLLREESTQNIGIRGLVATMEAEHAKMVEEYERLTGNEPAGISKVGPDKEGF